VRPWAFPKHIFGTMQNSIVSPKKVEFVIEAEGLRRSFGSVRALDGINLRIRKGELFGLLGPNGAGKTTMIKVLTGQLKPGSGKATVLGIDAAEDPVGVRRACGIVPEQETPPSFLSAEEYLHFVAAIRRLGSPEKEIGFWFDYLGFGDQRGVLCKDLSRGTRQKLMLAQAFIHKPMVAFIDEPIVNLDPIMQKRIKDYFKAYVSKGGTIFLSTHVLEIAEEICTRIGIIDRGRMIHEGTVAELKRKRRRLGDFFLSLVKE